MPELDLIVSWSGRMSHDAATAFYGWMGDVVPGIKPWISTEDIDTGTRWFGSLMAQLEKTATCVICVTPRNVGSPWIYFEAGAIAAKRGDAVVIPYLVGVEGSLIANSPLSQFQWATATKPDTWKLIRTINKGLASPHDETILKGHFDQKWPSLKRKLDRCIKEHALPENGDEEDEPETDGPEPLTHEAVIVLLEASSDPNNVIMMGVTSEGFYLQTNGKSLAERTDAREEATYRAAIEQLVSEGLVEDRSYKGEIFSVTAAGFKAADVLRAKLPPHTASTPRERPPIDDNDILSTLETWMSKRTCAQNQEVITFVNVDAECSLPSGSAERLLEPAGNALKYEVDRRGNTTIKFRGGPASVGFGKMRPTIMHLGSRGPR